MKLEPAVGEAGVGAESRNVVPVAPPVPAVPHRVPFRSVSWSFNSYAALERVTG